MNIEFPPHKAGLSLYHNAHKNHHASVAEFVDSVLRWPSEEAQRRAVETDELWELTWYPETPVGSYSIAAPTLAELLDFAKGFE